MTPERQIALIGERTNALVAKYSPDQAGYADRKLREQLSWGRRLLVRRLGILVPALHGDWLRDVFAEPEDGYASAPGNLLVAAGLGNISYLLLGTAASGANGRALSNANSCTGVGATSTAATVSDTHLGADGGSAWYQQMDATYPSWAGSGTANGGQLNGQVTVASGNGNFAWNEWGWTTGQGTITSGATLASVYGTGGDTAMLNHEVPASSLGTKSSGAVWVFSTTMTFSLSLGLVLVRPSGDDFTVMPGKLITCPNCGGDGWVAGRGGHHVDCPRCGGRGVVEVDDKLDDSSRHAREPDHLPDVQWQRADP
jgi:hypothetical protein